MNKNLGGDIAKTADLNWPEECPIPYDVTLSNKSWGIEGGIRGHSELRHFSSQVAVTGTEGAGGSAHQATSNISPTVLPNKRRPS